MSFPRYPEYKYSGDEWLGEVPAHWDVAPIKREFSIVGGSTPKSDVDRYWDGEIVWVSPADLSKLDSMVIEASQRMITEEGLTSCGTTMVPRGSIVLSTRAPIGSLAIAGKDLCTNQGCKSLVPKGANPWFYAYLLSVCTKALNVRGKGTTFLELSGDELGTFRIPVPMSTEQVAIACFLDKETAKIDELISEQEKLIALLNEKRQAVISHAVTKGLDPNVPMKDSGIEWLGEVPAHWGVAPLKRDVLFLTSGSRGWAEHYVDDGAIFIRIGNLKRESIDLDLSDIQRVSVPEGAEGERTRLAYGDVLFSITAYLGSVAVVPAEFEPAYVSQHVALVRLKQNQLLPEWAAYVALSIIGKTYLESQGYGGTKIQLSLGDVANVPMTIPPIPEQRLIINAVTGQLNGMDALIEEASTVISLLRERRSALISAAVTGKIDVRQYKAKEVA